MTSWSFLNLGPAYLGLHDGGKLSTQLLSYSPEVRVWPDRTFCHFLGYPASSWKNQNNRPNTKNSHCPAMETKNLTTCSLVQLVFYHKFEKSSLRQLKPHSCRISCATRSFTKYSSSGTGECTERGTCFTTSRNYTRFTAGLCLPIFCRFAVSQCTGRTPL